jgi:hypothetical protein
MSRSRIRACVKGDVPFSDEGISAHRRGKSWGAASLHWSYPVDCEYRVAARSLIATSGV